MIGQCVTIYQGIDVDSNHINFNPPGEEMKIYYSVY